MIPALCSILFVESCKQEEKGRRADVHPGLGGNLNQGPPEWQPCNLTSSLHSTHKNWIRVPRCNNLPVHI